MANNKVFISAPITTDWGTVMEFAISIRRLGGDPIYWDRESSYDQNKFEEADSVVFILPGNNFRMSQYGLPIGVKAELFNAFSAKKNIYLGFIHSTNSHKIYLAKTDGRDIQGVSGSEGSLKILLGAIRATDNIIANSTYGAWVENPCAEVTLKYSGPNGHPGKPGVEGNPFDERLILML